MKSLIVFLMLAAASANALVNDVQEECMSKNFIISKQKIV